VVDVAVQTRHGTALFGDQGRVLAHRA
jgi:hypothetical protein